MPIKDDWEASTIDDTTRKDRRRAVVTPAGRFKGGYFVDVTGMAPDRGYEPLTKDVAQTAVDHFNADRCDQIAGAISYAKQLLRKEL